MGRYSERECAACGKKFGLLEQKVEAFDGKICVNCWEKIGYKNNKKDLGQHRTNSV